MAMLPLREPGFVSLPSETTPGSLAFFALGTSQRQVNLVSFSQSRKRNQVEAVRQLARGSEPRRAMSFLVARRYRKASPRRTAGEVGRRKDGDLVGLLPSGEVASRANLLNPRPPQRFFLQTAPAVL